MVAGVAQSQDSASEFDPKVVLVKVGLFALGEQLAAGSLSRLLFGHARTSCAALTGA